MDAFSSSYDNLLLLGDFKAKTTEQHTKYFSLLYNCKNIIRDKNVLQKPRKPKVH